MCVYVSEHCYDVLKEGKGKYFDFRITSKNNQMLITFKYQEKKCKYRTIVAILCKKFFSQTPALGVDTPIVKQIIDQYYCFSECVILIQVSNDVDYCIILSIRKQYDACLSIG